MLPLDVVAVSLLVAGSWWAIAIGAWFRWERRFRTPARHRARLQERAAGRREWNARDMVVFGLPIVLPIALGLDGLFFEGAVLYASVWSFFSPWTLPLQAAGLIILSVGLPLFTVAAHLTAKEVFSKVPEERVLLDRGPYRYVRHPIYLSFVLIPFGLLLLAQNVPMAATLALLWYAGYSEEEAELVRRFGAEYREYRRRTGALLPRIRKAR